MLEEGIIETIQNHQQYLAGSTAAAISILRIDDVISSRASPPMPEGGEFDGMGMM